MLQTELLPSTIPAEEPKAKKEKKNDLKVEKTNENYLSKHQVEVLPSRFLAYPQDATIYFEPSTLGDVIKASQSKVSLGMRYKEKLKKIHTNFPKEKLTYYDFLWISVLMDISTFGNNELNITFICENKECGKSNKFKFKKNKIGFYDLGIDIDNNPDLPDFKLPVKVPTSTREYQFTPYNMEDLFFLDLKKLMGDPIALYAVQVRNNTHTDAEIQAYSDKHEMDFAQAEKELRFNQIYKELNEAPFGEVDWLTELEQLFNHGVIPVKRKCSSCKHENSVEIDGGAILVESFRGHNEFIRSKVIFG
jgi:hypothetical protein